MPPSLTSDPWFMRWPALNTFVAGIASTIAVTVWYLKPSHRQLRDLLELQSESLKRWDKEHDEAISAALEARFEALDNGLKQLHEAKFAALDKRLQDLHDDIHLLMRQGLVAAGRNRDGGRPKAKSKRAST